LDLANLHALGEENHKKGDVEQYDVPYGSDFFSFLLVTRPKRTGGRGGKTYWLSGENMIS
jgi:hypothetical protein